MSKRILKIKNWLYFLSYIIIHSKLSLPIEQLFHCLKRRVDDVLKIKPFIDAMINDNDYEIKCTGSDENRNSLKKLVNYYMPNTYQDIP